MDMLARRLAMWSVPRRWANQHHHRPVSNILVFRSSHYDGQVSPNVSSDIWYFVFSIKSESILNKQIQRIYVPRQDSFKEIRNHLKM